MKLEISKDLSLPIEAVTQTFAVLAKRGSGKTYTGCVMVEGMLGAGQQVVITDPIGVWWGLRSSADGKSPGFPIVVFGGEHGDVPLEEHAGEIVAQSIVENGFSAVLDLSLFRKAAQVRFMTAFAETLYRLNRKPLHLVVDEADEFAPQRPMHGTERLLGAFEDIVRRGRARGLGVTLITQRAAVLNKNVLTQIEVLIVLRTISPQDRAAIEAWTEIHGTKKQLEQLSETMASLPIGTAWFWSPGWLDIFQKIVVRKKITFDSSATPKVGEVITKPKALAEVNLEQLGAQIKATAESAKANDPAELRRKIASLKKELEQNPRVKIEKSEVPVLVDTELGHIKAVIQEFRSQGEMLCKLEKSFSKSVEEIRKHRNAIEPTLDQIGRELERFAERTGRNKNHWTISVPPQRAMAKTVVHTANIAPAVRRTAPPINGAESDLGKCERSLLSVLAKFPEGCTRQKLILLAGYAWSGSTQNALGKLRSLGLIEGQNIGLLKITEQGTASVKFEPLPEGEELKNYWLNYPYFGKCERTLLRCLTESPNGMSREDLLAVSGYEWSGSTQNALGALRTAGVITGRNTETMKASDEFFQ